MIETAAAGALGFALGWIIRSALDRAVHTIVIKVLTAAVGKEKVAAAMKSYLAKENG